MSDTGPDAHVIPKHVWEQLGEPTLQTTKVTLRGATGQDLGATGEVQVRSLMGKYHSSVHSSGCTRCETMPSEWNATQNKGLHVHVVLHGSFLTQPSGRRKVTMSRERNRDTLKVVCMLKPEDAQSVTSLMLRREVENARRELRNLKTGQHENKRENAAGEMTMDEKDHARASWTCHIRSEVRNVSQSAKSVNTPSKSSRGSCIL